jgi:hypothetical protein
MQKVKCRGVFYKGINPFIPSPIPPTRVDREVEHLCGESTLGEFRCIKRRIGDQEN